MQSSDGTRGLRLLVAGLFVACVSYQARDTLASLRLAWAPATLVGVPLSLDAASNQVTHASDEAQRAGLREGDRVLAVDGRPLRGLADLARPLAKARAGDRLRLLVRSGPSEGMREVETVLVPRGENTLTGGDWVLLLGLGVLTPWLCLLLGFSVAFLRPRDGRAWLLLLLLVSFSQLANADPMQVAGWGAVAATLGVAYSHLLGQLWPVGMLLFGVAFPERLELDRRFPWIKWLVVVPLTLQALGFALRDALAVLNVAAAGRVQQAVPALNGLHFALVMIAISSFFTAMGLRMGSTKSPDVRRRLSLLMWGSNLSLTPMGAVFIYSQITGHSLTGMSPWIVVPVLALLMGFPVTLAYVIVVERALDVRVVVRQGLQYALARNGILAMQILVSAVIIFTAASLATNPGVNRPRIIGTVAAGVMFVFITRQAAERVRASTDRRFFREAYDAEQILGELGDTVRTMVEEGPLLETVSQRIQESLHVPRVLVLLRQGGEYVVAHALGAAEPLPRIGADSPLAERLRTLQPLRVYADDPQAEVNRDPALARERPALLALGAELLLPLAIKDRLLGILALGRKQSEAPYSKSDLRLLQSVATQTAFALENSHLTAAVASEVALRARMSREVEIAREVQERLFPQDRPAVRGLDYAGACRPALGVGGDYFDFLELPGGRLGLAIGDVSGKGISAALLMASLQASLRGQSLAGALDLSTLMGNVNQLIYEASQSNRYATFFYGTYDPAERRLRYVNAGHNAPMLLRRTHGELTVQRLDQGGPVIGMLFPVPYTEASVTLEPGDLLVAYTDGISEAMNVADEEWGEERLQAAAAAAGALGADDLVGHLFAEADAFVAGAKQHDDMTLVVARVLDQ